MLSFILIYPSTESDIISKPIENILASLKPIENFLDINKPIDDKLEKRLDERMEK